uniref:Serine/threonine-protein phosphatase 4 regulatory subunit 1 n=1 Tax=Scleropages formosus TaxID=113540 RepID=A0A8C9RI83_SCLFO
FADLSLLQEDSQEDTDGSLDLVSQDELLSPLARLDKYAASENVFNRQMVARSLLDTLKAVSEDEGDCFAVLERVSRLADDSEPTVRAELMEQIPHIAIFCQEHRPSVPSAFSKYLLPIVVRYLADQNNQVRKTSQAALLVLLEQDLIERADVESQICPVLVDLTAPDSNDDVKTEAMAIICKMAPMVGKDITERLFLPRFCEMCCDCRMFHVRKVCAANFGDMCSVVGGEATEELLLPRFFQLCSDNVWGVRKACAECFMTVSSATSQEVRRTKLSSLFISLISDPSRWVRQAAFQSLGQFISTFASPSNVGQCFREEQVEDYRCSNLTSSCSTPDASSSCEELLLQDSCSRAPEQRQEEEEGSVDLGVEGGGEQVAEALTSDVSCDSEAASESSRNPGDHCCSTSAAAVAEVPDAGPFEEQVLPPLLRCAPQEGTVLEQELYNSFHYWRTPIPAIDLDVELGSPGSSAAPVLGRKELEELIENLEPHIDDPDVKGKLFLLTFRLYSTLLKSHVERSTSFLFFLCLCHQNCESVRHRQDEDSDLGDNNLSPEEKSKQQDVVPQALLDQYLSMTDPSRAQTVDMEIAKHCAYSLPGVALTLGRQNWHCLRDTYETLASDMQWKVRRTLAFSIHELALILGDQLTAADLVPIFNSFLKDLDEVRIGVLKHLYDFLKLLHQETRRKYLYQLQEFLVTDNSRNWRFRSELAEQLVLLLELYSAQDVYDYLRPLAFSLCTDRVSSVRWISYKLVSEMVRKLSSNTALVTEFLVELVDKFCHSPKWSGRQAFAFVCQLVVEDDCLSLEQFSKHLLGPLLQLASDPVPNVRVLLAKTLRQSLLEREYFVHSGNSHQEALEQTLVALQTDLDKDVKYFASVHPGSTRISEDALSTASSTY